MNYFPQVAAIEEAEKRLKGVAEKTPLIKSLNLSERYHANIYLKREDLQQVRSYKIRGAYNKIASLSPEQQAKGVVCASAGNHAQGVAFSCRKLQLKGKIYMPETTPKQKIEQVHMFGREYVEVILQGDTFDDSKNLALLDSEHNKSVFIHPFDDPKIIEGQATVGLEIYQKLGKQIDCLIAPIGGGGLIAGVGSYFKTLAPNVQLIGVEPQGAPSMQEALKAGKVVELDEIDKFIDGAAVKSVGTLNLEIAKQVVDRIQLVPEGLVCSTILRLYNQEAIVSEPAGALSIAALELLKEEIKGKTVVCVLSGSNNDITRTEEIRERSLLYEGLKHYFIIRFPQRAGALKEFVNDVLGEHDDISHFEYQKKHSKERGPALIGIELRKPEDLQALKKRMTAHNIYYEYLNDQPDLMQYLV